MYRMIRKFLRRNAALVLAGPLTVAAIVAYNMLEWLEKYHPKLVANVYYGIAAVLLFGAFYLIGIGVRGLRRDEDRAEDLWPKQPY